MLMSKEVEPLSVFARRTRIGSFGWKSFLGTTGKALSDDLLDQRGVGGHQSLDGTFQWKEWYVILKKIGGSGDRSMADFRAFFRRHFTNGLLGENTAGNCRDDHDQLYRKYGDSFGKTGFKKPQIYRYGIPAVQTFTPIR
jgi:hypothetical protein